MLLASVWYRLLVAACIIAALWTSVLWVAPTTPSTNPAQAPIRVAAQPAAMSGATQDVLRAVVRSGDAAPNGGRFDRFDVPGQPVLAPVNARGQVAFYATVLRSAGREGIFMAEAGRVRKIAGYGDAVPGGGTLAEFAHPLPALNGSGHVAFAAQIAGGRATEGIFLAGDAGLQVIALAGEDAPALPNGVLVGFDTPALNDNDELTFVATVRRGRDLLDVLYFWNGRRLQKVVAEGERLLRIGGTMDKIGTPALNNTGVIAFPAAILKGPSPGGIFVAGARDLRLLVSAGDRVLSGMILRFSEHVAIDEADGAAFGAYIGGDGSQHEAVLRMTPEGIKVIAVEGEAAPDGGRYAGFGPWPTMAPDGVVGFIAALNGAAGPMAAFAADGDAVRRVATMGVALPNGGRPARFALNAIAAVGLGGGLTFATTAQEEGERSAIYCHCPAATASSTDQ
jgi:hypothetical protein